jgi:hypothetical protein
MRLSCDELILDKIFRRDSVLGDSRLARFPGGRCEVIETATEVRRDQA